MRPFRSELAFAAFLTYCPRGDTRDIRRSQRFMWRLKGNRVLRSNRLDETASKIVARRLRERAEKFTSELLGKDTSLVPMPRSGQLWPHPRRSLCSLARPSPCHVLVRAEATLPAHGRGRPARGITARPCSSSSGGAASVATCRITKGIRPHAPSEYNESHWSERLGKHLAIALTGGRHSEAIGLFMNQVAQELGATNTLASARSAMEHRILTDRNFLKMSVSFDVIYEDVEEAARGLLK